jgi:hypothetical protein
VDVKLVLHENHSLALVGEGTISQYIESECNNIRRYQEILEIPDLATVALHGCGQELTYSDGSTL